MNWAKLIKDIRMDLLISQADMAKKLGVAFCTVNRYENGHWTPTIKVKHKIKNLATHLGINFASYKEN